MQPAPPQRPIPQISFDEFVAMCAAAKVWGPSGGAGYYRIDLGLWTAIETQWMQWVGNNPQFANHEKLVEAEAKRLQTGGAPRPIPSLHQNFERQAEQVGNAVGSAAVAGFNALGSAFDGIGKSLTAPSVGSRVMVQWSDGQRYPGTVAQVGQGQYFVTMQNGQQLWVPTNYVTSA